MKTKDKQFSIAGRKGRIKRTGNHQRKRSELFKALSGLTAKFWVDTIMFSKHRWSNDDIQELIVKLRTKSK